MTDKEIEDKIYKYLKKELLWKDSWNWRVLQIVKEIVKIVKENKHKILNQINKEQRETIEYQKRLILELKEEKQKNIHEDIFNLDDILENLNEIRNNYFCQHAYNQFNIFYANLLNIYEKREKEQEKLKEDRKYNH